MKVPIALSYSRLSTYQDCPYKFKSQYIDKDYPDESDNPHFARGSRIHKQLEDYTIWSLNKTETVGSEPAMSAEAGNGRNIINNVVDNYDSVVPERQLAANMDWVKCDWYAKPTEVKYRAIVDLMAIRGDEGLMIDWKTGKVREYAGFGGQLHLSGSMIMSMLPSLETLKLTYMYVDHKQSSSIELKRSDLQENVEHFNEQYEIVNNDEEFKPTKHKYCNFCLIKDRCPLYGK